MEHEGDFRLGLSLFGFQGARRFLFAASFGCFFNRRNGCLLFGSCSFAITY
jgi:hypothetical protein